MSHTTLAQGVSARHTIHVSCACVFDLSSTLSSHSSFVSPIFHFIFYVDRFGAKPPCALPRMRSLALWSTTPLSHLLPTEATADAMEPLYQTTDAAQKRTSAPFEPPSHFPKSDVQQQHTLTHIRDAMRQPHPGPSGERNSHISALLVSPCGLVTLTKWVQLWADKKLDPAFTEPCPKSSCCGDVPTSHANHQAPAARPDAKDVRHSQDAFTTPHALPSPSDVIQSPSRLSLLQPGGPGWVPRCWCGLMTAMNMRMTKD